VNSPYFPLFSALTARAEKGRAAALNNPLDQRFTAAAGIASTIINIKPVLEVAKRSVRRSKVLQG
jgi:hypothetical protein